MFIRLKKSFPRKTSQVVVAFVALAIVPYVIPSLERYRVMIPKKLTKLLGVGADRSAAAASIESTSAKVNDAPSFQTTTPGEIEDASGHSLNAFFESLMQT